MTPAPIEQETGWATESIRAVSEHSKFLIHGTIGTPYTVLTPLPAANFFVNYILIHYRRCKMMELLTHIPMDIINIYINKFSTFAWQPC
jgi:hypothetical protein